MRLNKNTLYVLRHLLSGYRTSSEISNKMKDVDVRSIQRALERLSDARIVTRTGPSNNPTYSIDYLNLLSFSIPDKILEDEQRPESSFNHELFEWVLETSAADLEQSPIGFELESTDKKISAKELEYLTVELSWKSSALEGNTYTLLDTQILLTEGIKAKGKTEFETQMVLNHKNAITFIASNPELFNGDIKFATLEELHRIISENLDIPLGVRKKLVRISASNYTPLSNPQQLRESAENALRIINKFSDPFMKSLMALSLIPYLQTFEDGNKRTGRMLANAILISTIGKGFSLRKVSAKELALAYLSFYEFNSIKSLSKTLKTELS
jgi:Fic family protein